MFILNQIVPRGEQDVFRSDNHATEFLIQLCNKKNKVIQVSYSSALRHKKSYLF